MATGSGSAKTTGGIFLRQSSGLVRELSIWDAVIFGILGSAPYFAFVDVFPLPQFNTPGVSIPLMLLLTTLAAVPVVVCYAALGSAMPRAGGDYLYMSRSIAPPVGFAIPFGWAALLWTIFYPLAAFVFVNYGLVPILLSASVTFNVTGLSNLATWFQSQPGQLVATIFLAVVAWGVTVSGVGAYRKLQRWFFLPAIIVTDVVLIGLLLFSSNTSFKSAFDSYSGEPRGKNHLRRHPSTWRQLMAGRRRHLTLGRPFCGYRSCSVSSRSQSSLQRGCWAKLSRLVTFGNLA